MKKILLSAMIMLGLAGCSSSEKEDQGPQWKDVKVGECLEEAFGVYTYKVLKVHEDKVYAHKIGTRQRNYLSPQARWQKVRCP